MGMSRLRGRTPLSAEDAGSRITAYVYGNIIVLSSLVPLGRSDAESGRSFWIVLAISFATFLAHAQARVSRPQRPELAPPGRADGRAPRSVPVLTSGLVPAALVLAAWLGDFPGHQAQRVAEAYVLLRLASTGLAIGRACGQRASLQSVSRASPWLWPAR